MSFISLQLRELNLNSYATKKTIAQAILDLALLAANASQLKFILSVGEKHEFYHIILWLVVASIILQVWKRFYEQKVIKIKPIFFLGYSSNNLYNSGFGVEYQSSG